MLLMSIFPSFCIWLVLFKNKHLVYKGFAEMTEK